MAPDSRDQRFCALAGAQVTKTSGWVDRSTHPGTSWQSSVLAVLLQRLCLPDFLQPFGHGLTHSFRSMGNL